MWLWCRRLGWISFWAQLALSIVSATILSFAVSSSMQAGHLRPKTAAVYLKQRC